MDERQIAKVADWLADGWDWDMIGAAIGIDGEEAYRRHAADAAEYLRRMEREDSGRVPDS